MSYTNKINSGILNKSVLVFLVKIFGSIIAVGLQMYIAQILGPEEYGIYSFVLSWVVILSVFSGFGFQHLQACYVSIYSSKKQFYKIILLVKSARLFVFIMGVIISVSVSAILYMMDSFISKEVSSVLFIGVLIIPAQALIVTNNGIFRGLKKQIYASFINELIRPVILLLLVFFLMRFTLEITAEILMELTFSSLIITMLLSMYLIRKNGKKISSKFYTANYNSFRIQIASSLRWSKLAIPFILYTAVTQVEKNIDILMIGALSNMESVGIYSVATRITSIVLLTTVTLNMVASPFFSEFHALGKFFELQKVVSNITTISSILNLVVLIIVIHNGKEIISMFGIQYVEGYEALNLLVLSQFIKTLAGPVLMLSLMTGQQKIAVKTITIGILIHIMLNFILIPELGIIGAAVSASISIIIWSLLLAYLIYKKIGINPSIFSIIRF